MSISITEILLYTQYIQDFVAEIRKTVGYTTYEFDRDVALTNVEFAREEVLKHTAQNKKSGTKRSSQKGFRKLGARFVYPTNKPVMKTNSKQHNDFTTNGSASIMVNNNQLQGTHNQGYE